MVKNHPVSQPERKRGREGGGEGRERKRGKLGNGGGGRLGGGWREGRKGPIQECQGKV